MEIHYYENQLFHLIYYNSLQMLLKCLFLPQIYKEVIVLDFILMKLLISFKLLENHV